MRYQLKKGFKSLNGQVEIVGVDSLCYKIKNNSKGSVGIRTISKDLLNEYIDYFEKNSDNTAAEAREYLSGKSDIDKYEYGYTSTLTTLAKMVLGEQLSQQDKVISVSNHAANISTKHLDYPLQQIFFGAPGTGKSHSIKAMSSIYEHYRITFHPDTDYASFVGTYKPTTIEVPIRDASGYPIKHDNQIIIEEKITYKFVQQAFLKAYVAAWKEQEKGEPRPVFLVIEEINRGNCAQIFGDIFQLLDRNEEGFSDYPIHADTDLSKELGKAFADLKVANADGINALYDGKDIVGEIKKGTQLLLPNNLYIWATMNTSDQSLFPIDSAFKRRWDWKYIKIADSRKGYVISVNNKEYDWWEFLKAINEHIGTTTSQEDKKLGYFFAKAAKTEDGKYVISADKFLSKVLFFLYGDVYKDYGFDDDIFKGENGTPMEFSDYFDESGKAIEEKIEKFLLNLGLESKGTKREITNIEDAEILEPADADRKTSSRLTVEFPDGTTMKERYQFDTYLKALQKIGLAKALQIASQRQYVRKDEPLISKIQSQKIIDDPKYSYVQSGDYYIIKGIDLGTQINFLELLSQKLNLGLNVYTE